jgi:hypothetical protein
MKLDYLPKLLLQHDESPYLNELNLIRASETEKLVYCVHPRGYAYYHYIQYIVGKTTHVYFSQN